MRKKFLAKFIVTCKLSLQMVTQIIFGKYTTGTCRTQLVTCGGDNLAVPFLPFRSRCKHASGLFTIQGELEDLLSRLGRIFLVAVTKNEWLPVYACRSCRDKALTDLTEGIQYGLVECSFCPITHHHYV